MPALLRYALAALLMASPLSATAHEHGNAAHEPALETVHTFMAGLNAKDASIMSAQVLDGSTLVVVRENDEGNAVRSMAMGDVITALASIPSDIREPLADVQVMVDGSVAMVWAPFTFYRDEEFSHCGVNIFTLVETEEGWRITNVTYSHVTEGCTDGA